MVATRNAIAQAMADDLGIVARNLAEVLKPVLFHFVVLSRVTGLFLQHRQSEDIDEEDAILEYYNKK